MQDQANYILGAQARGACEVNITMFVEIDREGATPEECRRGYMGNPARLRKDRDVLLIEESTSPETYTRFDQTWRSSSGQVTQNQLYGYWTRGELCFEIHLSSIQCPSFTEQARPILDSVRIGPDTGATLETVSLALEGGPDPLGWESHQLVGGLYLHKAEPRNPARARRFYDAALRIGGEAILQENRYLIEAGNGIAWLMQDKGAEAIPHLERALGAARAMPDIESEPKPSTKDDAVKETLYNLACAHSLAGNTSAACDRAREHLETMNEAERNASLKDYRKDKQLKALRKSVCFKTLLKDLFPD